MNRTNIVETVINKDERVEKLKSRLQNLIEENHILCSQITNKGETIRKSLRRSSFVQSNVTNSQGQNQSNVNVHSQNRGENYTSQHQTTSQYQTTSKYQTNSQYTSQPQKVYESRTQTHYERS